MCVGCLLGRGRISTLVDRGCHDPYQADLRSPGGDPPTEQVEGRINQDNADTRAEYPGLPISPSSWLTELLRIEAGGLEGCR